MIYNFNKVCNILLLCGAFPFLVVSCSEKEDDAQLKKEQREALARLEIKKQEKRELLLEKEQNLKLANIKAEEDAAKAKFLKEQLIIENREAEQKLADEKESLRQQDILRRQDNQKLACDKYVNTKYAELVLLDGRVLKSAQVTRATPMKVTFVHKSGVARVEYSNLPKEIRLTCKYNEELEALELENLKLEEDKRAKRKRLAPRPSEILETSNQDNYASKSKPSYRAPIKVQRPVEKKLIKPRGKLSVRTIGSTKGGKTIEVIAISNVDATLYLNDYRSSYREYQVKANVKYSHTWSNVNVKYVVKLTANGKILDKESSGRKSGLGIKKGL
ncbi:MAG: hypothetical protein ACI9E1_000884 [Cryomorphaceae bacterium]|jgi:hypothetical protein